MPAVSLNGFLTESLRDSAKNLIHSVNHHGMTKGVVAGIFARYVGRRLEDDVDHAPPGIRRIEFWGVTALR